MRFMGRGMERGVMRLGALRYDTVWCDGMRGDRMRGDVMRGGVMKGCSGKTLQASRGCDVVEEQILQYLGGEAKGPEGQARG